MSQASTPSRFSRNRPQIGSLTLCLLTTIFLAATANNTFWSKAWGYFTGEPIAFAAFALSLFVLGFAVVAAFSAKYFIKPALIFLLFAAAGASWFIDEFGVVIDKEMIRNAVVSTGAEAGHLMTPRFFLHMLLFAILPSAFVAWVRVVHRPIRQKLYYNSLAILGCVAVAAVACMTSYRTIFSVERANRDLISQFNPLMPIQGAVQLAKSQFKDRSIVAQPIGTDAHRTHVSADGRPRVAIVVLGETARAQDFSLNGYGRVTNPSLAQQNIVYFSNMSSCGTSTGVSLPCMFSLYGRADYTHRKGLATQNLVDVLKNAKVNVSWLDNDTGDYHIADRIPYEFLPTSADPRFCKGGECLDEILIDKVDGWLDQVKGDSVLFLHQLGSHGPAYFARYPDEYRKFVPDCRANDFGDCTPEEITNAYDNTILYTDHIVSSVIDKLKARSNIDASMIYLSDHGESLGENGIYLHGLPYFAAPTQQTHVPFLTWMSDSLAKSAGFDMACLAKKSADTTSHDNFFPSVLGLMDVETKVYNPALDLFAGCRVTAPSVAAN
ncbi:phosphoethanolamine transferase [Mesorhizobium sp. A623]